MINIITIDTLKYNWIYLNKIIRFPYKDPNDSNKVISNLFILNNLSLQDNINILKNRLIFNRLNYSYYIDRIITFNVASKRKKYILQQNKVYKNLRKQIPRIRKVFTKLDQYKKVNLYYDIQPYNDLFFNFLKIPITRKISLYKNYITNLINREVLNSYNNKYLLFYIDENFDINSLIKKKIITNPLSLLINYIYYFEKELVDFKHLICIIFTEKGLLQFKPSELKKKDLIRLKALIKKLYLLCKHKKDIKEDEINNITNNDIEETNKEEISNEIPVRIIDKEELPDINDNNTTGLKSLDNKSNLKDKLLNKIRQSLYDNIKADDEEEKEIFGEITNRIQERIDDEEFEGTFDIEDLEKDDEIKKSLINLKNEKVANVKSKLSSKRDELLRKNQLDIQIMDDFSNKPISIKDLKEEIEFKTITEKKFNISNLRNKKIDSCKITDFDSNYNKKLFTKDQLSAINSLSNPDRKIPIYIRKITKVDSSDAFNKKETLTIQLEDELRKRHQVTIDVPKLVDNKYLYINGSKKYITKQLMPLPIIKTSKDSVQVVSNYRKLFLTRFGSKINPSIELFKKYLENNKSKNITFIKGDNTLINTKYLNTLEYDNIAAIYMEVNFEKEGYNFIFNHQHIEEIIEDKNFILTEKMEKYLPIGLSNFKRRLLLVNTDNNNLIEMDNKGKLEIIAENFVDFLNNLMISNNKYDNIKITSSKMIYSRALILNINIPLVLLLGFKDGLSSLLKTANISYTLDERRLKIDNEKMAIIPFKDCYMYYKINPFKNALLLNGMYDIPTKEYNFDDFNNTDTYLEIFNTMYGSKTIAKGLDNFIEVFLDPITVEVLKDNNLPTDLTNVLLYANALLEDNSCISDNNMANYRIRSNEVINSVIKQ